MTLLDMESSEGIYNRYIIKSPAEAEKKYLMLYVAAQNIADPESPIGPRRGIHLVNGFKEFDDVSYTLAVDVYEYSQYHGTEQANIPVVGTFPQLTYGQTGPMDEVILHTANIFVFDDSDKARDYFIGIAQFDNSEDAYNWALNYAHDNATNYNAVVGTNCHFKIFIDGETQPSITISGGFYNEEQELQEEYQCLYQYLIKGVASEVTTNPLELTFNALVENTNASWLPEWIIAASSKTIDYNILRRYFLPEGVNYLSTVFNFQAAFNSGSELYPSKAIRLYVPYSTKDTPVSDVRCEIFDSGTNNVPTSVMIVYGKYDPTKDDFNNNDESSLDNDLDTSDSVFSNGLANALTRTYLMTQLRLQTLGNKLWSNSFFDNIKLINNNPMENIINCNVCRVGGLSGTDTEIVIGNVDMDMNGELVSTSLCELNIGSFNIPHLYKSFLDFAPYTNITIYLPYCGHRELDPNIIMDRTVTVKAVIDIISGTITYKLYTENLLIYEFNGMCSVSIPLAGMNNSQVLAGYIQGGLSTIGSSASGAMAGAGVGGVPGAIVGGVMGGLGGAINTAFTQYHSSTNGNMSPSNILAECTRCFVIIDRPSVTYPSAYAHTQGRPCNLTLPLSELSGYTELVNPDITGLHCPQVVMDDLLQQLETGFYL